MRTLRKLVIVPLFLLSSCIGSCIELNGCVIDLGAKDADELLRQAEESTWSDFMRLGAAIEPGEASK